MKTQKRDKVEKAFHSGFKAGVRGRSTEGCPYTSVITMRSAWMGGWREGRDQYLTGFLNPADI